MASKISGVSIYRIRAWEKRYHALTPKRKSTGHRFYNKNQVEKLSLLQQLCLAGHSISHIAKLSNGELQAQANELSKNEMKIPKIIKDENLDQHLSESLMIILLALKNYNLDVISKELDKIKVKISPKDFAFKIIVPIMSGLGQAVHQGEFSITHEHALSSIVKFHIGHLIYQQQLKPNSQSLDMIICGIEGDYHEFGILLSAIIAIEAGINVIYLGAHMPPDSLADAVNAIDPDYVVIGATNMVGNFGNNYVEKYIHKLAFKIDSKCKIIVGSARDFTPWQKLKKQTIHLRSLEEFNQFVEELK